MRRLPLLVVTLALTLPVARVNAGDWSGDQDLANRLKQLEEETQNLRSEVNYLRENPVRLPAADSTDARLMSTLAEPVIDDTDYFSLDEIKAEMKKLVWGKGDFHIVPYGFFWADMVYQTQRTQPGSYTLFVPQRSVQGEDAFFVDARRSRFGLDVTGPEVPLFHFAKSGGRLEIDFQGFFVTENKAGVLLRHAYWEAKDDYFRFLVGQTSDVISPLVPGTLNYSVGWFGGNIGYRRTQFRYERYMHLSPTALLTAQISANQDIISDFSNVSGTVREPASWPVFEGRLATTLGDRSECGLPITLGVSGHIGKTGFDFLSPGPPPLSLPPESDRRFRTWSINADFHVPLTDRFGIQGECYSGANLSPFLGGIGQGVCPCLRVPIRDTGGWIDVWYDWTPRLHTHFGYSLDDPNNKDSLLGRTYNQFFFANFSVDLTKKLVMGIEVSYWQTFYHDTRVGQIPDDQLSPADDGESVVFDWVVKYAF